jgi:hypothetical protein
MEGLMSDIRRINVVMSGVYAYVVGKNEVVAFTPAQKMHIYQVGWKLANCNNIDRGDYDLVGVKGEKGLPYLDNTKTPIVDANKVRVGESDPFTKSYMTIHLPFPEEIYPLEPYVVGEISEGSAADAINALEQFPSLYAFVYERDPDRKLGFVPRSEYGKPVDCSGVPSNDPPADHTANIFVLATMLTGPMESDGKIRRLFGTKEREAHTRRAFASMVDLFCELDLRIAIPDGFSPTKTDYRCPEGLEPAQVEAPAPCVTHWGKVNCHYSNVVIINYSL